MHIADILRRKPFQDKPKGFGSLPQCVPQLARNNGIGLFLVLPGDQAQFPV